MKYGKGNHPSRTSSVLNTVFRNESVIAFRVLTSHDWRHTRSGYRCYLVALTGFLVIKAKTHAMMSRTPAM